MNRRDLLQRLAAAAGAGAAAKAGVIDLTKVASVAEPKKVSLLVPGLYSYNTYRPFEFIQDFVGDYRSWMYYGGHQWIRRINGTWEQIS